MVFDTQPDPNILEVHVTLSEYAKKNKSLCTNHPHLLCDTYELYSHHFPHLEDFHDSLHVLHELVIASSDSHFSLLVGPSNSSSLVQEVSQPNIVIPPPNVELTDNSTPIIYFSSFMGSI